MSKTSLLGVLGVFLLGIAAPAQAQDPPGPKEGAGDLESVRRELAEARRLLDALLERQRALEERLKQAEARLRDLLAGPPLPVPPVPYLRVLGVEGLRKALEGLASGDAGKAEAGALDLASASDLEALASDPAVARFAEVRVLLRDDFSAGPGAWKEHKGGRGTKELRWAPGGAVRWERRDSGADGGSVGVSRPLAADVAAADYLVVGGRILVESHSLGNSGWASDAKGGHGEYPAHVQVAFLDEAEKERVWSHGFLASHDGSTQLVNFTRVPAGEWTTFGFDLMEPSARAPRDPSRSDFELPRPAILKSVLLQGNGWDFAGAAGGVVLVAVTAKEDALKRKPAAPPGGRESEDALPERPEPGKARRFAIGMSGTSGTPQHAKWYRNSTGMLYRMLTGTFGYSPHAVYYLYEDPKASEEIDGQANFVNFQRLMRRMAKMTRRGDQLLIYMIGHGGFFAGHSRYNFVGRDLLDAELAAMLDALPLEDVVVVMSPCNMGNFVNACSKKSRVIVSSTRRDEGNSAGFAEAFIQALDENRNDADKDGRASLKEAYDYTLGRVRDWYKQKNLPEVLEHALLDDDGNGEGHHGEGVVEGDGAFAAKVFLGDGGRKIEPDPAFEKWLQECNRTLELDFTCRE
ncbi:MAG: hypothetical protein MUC63_04435 [Planctomycetes bacterium]|jgi:hypothetical protein|nr:hypothetical protein [Planctomycetota bacterium]